MQAAVRAHRHEASGRRGSLIFDGEADVELDADKQKKRMAVDHGRVRRTTALIALLGGTAPT